MEFENELPDLRLGRYRRYHRPDFRWKNNPCDYCDDYDISGSVYEPNTLAGMDLERRIAALHRAKQSKGEKIRLMIMTYDL